MNAGLIGGLFLGMTNVRDESLKELYKNTIDDNNEMFSSSNNKQKETSYEQTLIERNYRDPSPTVRADFRVIGNVGRIKTNS